MKVILASNSPRRKELLKKIYEEFSIVPSEIEETLPEDIGPAFAPIFLSAQKAQEIAKRFPEYLVIGADTIVVLDGEILGKPKNKQEAHAMLRSLSGNTHTVITGVCLCLNGESTTFSEETEVTFYDLTDEEIDDYIKTGSPLDKAGAYGIQDDGALFVQSVCGDVYNVIGLPIARLKREINDFVKTCGDEE